MDRVASLVAAIQDAVLDNCLDMKIHQARLTLAATSLLGLEPLQAVLIIMKILSETITVRTLAARFP